MRLPDVARAFVDVEKLRGYCLNLHHPRGRNKARVFASALGLTESDSEILRETILSAILTEEAQIGERDDFGQRYVVDFEMKRDARRAPIRTSWIVRTGEDFPRLTSCYIL